MNEPARLMTPQEVAELCQISVKTVYKEKHWFGPVYPAGAAPKPTGCQVGQRRCLPGTHHPPGVYRHHRPCRERHLEKGSYAVRLEQAEGACAIKRVKESDDFWFFLSNNPEVEPIVMNKERVQNPIIGRVIWPWTNWVRRESCNMVGKVLLDYKMGCSYG